MPYQRFGSKEYKNEKDYKNDVLKKFHEIAKTYYSEPQTFKSFVKSSLIALELKDQGITSEDI
jgi:hypothetical protein